MKISRPIQTQPAGLLGFLQLKNAGQNPADLPDLLQPVIEMRDWMFLTNSETEGGVDAAVLVAGLVNKITVPPNEWWAVHETNMTAQLAVGSTAVITPYYRQAASGILSLPMPLTPPTTWAEATMGGTVSLNMVPRHVPLLIPPGGILGTRYFFLSAATTAGNLFVRFTRLRV